MTQLTRTFAALSDPTRLSLVETLIASGELPAGALAAQATISAPAISRHLKVLREAGVVRQRIEGTHRFYSVDAGALARINSWTMDHRSFWGASLDRLDGMLALDPEGEDQ
ncbi:ArsR/SmtB family transcription factor [Pseudooceanicola nitratireducens]|uniref:ArsR/SmtB family transcription factor n=1 Tax=Pseudooceanicola nitratireducens TaxID=517719 RepID=UPI0023F4F5F0|nr:metalloregulator ArsR/SmtB family transcription factor [Pseudooceanicola nitratireducens]